MTLSEDNIVQSNTGTVVAGTTATTTLPSGTTAGNTLILIILTSGTVTQPTGFTLDGANAQGPSVYHKATTAGETSWAVTMGSGDAVWHVMEVSGLDDDPLDVTQASNPVSVASGTAVATPSVRGYGLSTMSMSAHTALVLSGTPTLSYAGHTNGYTEVAETSSTGTTKATMSVARKFNDGAPSTHQCTATITTSTGNATTRGRIVAFLEKDKPVASPIAFHTGFEFGTTGGIGSLGPDGLGLEALLKVGTYPPAGTFGTNYAVDPAAARNGDYGLRITAASSIANVSVWAVTPFVGVYGFNVRVVSGTGVVNVASVDLDASGSGTDANLVYDTSTNKFGVQWGAGAVTYQSGTTALNTWAWVDLRTQGYGVTTHTARWRIETGTDTYTDQTTVSLPGQLATRISARLILGSLSSQTMVAHYDDVVASSYSSAYPLGPHKVTVLKVDPAGTPTVFGTAANFNVFTANGTMAAFNAANARAAVDELPPDISATADGIAQVTAAASDYVEFPMDTYTLASNEVVAAVRMVAALWSASAATASIGIRGWDGTTEVVLYDGADLFDPGRPTATTSTAPMWVASGWDSWPGWTKAELDNAALRVGFSTDATPDIGINAMYLEVAARKTMTIRQLTLEEGLFSVDVDISPYTSASVQYTITSTDPGRGASFSYSIAGADQGVTYIPPNSVGSVVVSADAFGDISDVTLLPDA